MVWAITLVIGVLSAQLRSQAETDALTGTLNRQGLARAARQLIALGERTESLLTVAILDLDGFKAVNDTLGHAAGDRLLAETVAAWRDGLRASDVLARPGGDEFVLLLPATGRSGAARVLDRLRAHSPSPFSHGLATVAPGETLESALARADRDLYARRQRGPSAVSRRARPRRWSRDRSRRSRADRRDWTGGTGGAGAPGATGGTGGTGATAWR